MLYLLLGVVYGASSPFLARLQHRWPRTVAAASLLLLGLSLQRFPSAVGGASAPSLAASTVGGLFLVVAFASSVAEVLAGGFTRTGKLLGRAARLMRLLLTSLMATGLLLVPVLWSLNVRGLPQVPFTGLVCALLGTWPLERALARRRAGLQDEARREAERIAALLDTPRDVDGAATESGLTSGVA